MTKTVITGLSHCFINSSATVMMPLDKIVAGIFVWPAKVPSARTHIEGRVELLRRFEF